MAVRAAKPGDHDGFQWFTLAYGDDEEECHYCGAEIVMGYINACIVICAKCASRRRVPVIASSAAQK